MHSENVPTQSLVQTLSAEKKESQEQSPKPRQDKRPMTEEQLEMEKKKKKGSAVSMKDAINSRRTKHQKLLEQLREAEARRIAAEEGTLHLQGPNEEAILAILDSDIQATIDKIAEIYATRDAKIAQEIVDAKMAAALQLSMEEEAKNQEEAKFARKL